MLKRVREYFKNRIVYSLTGKCPKCGGHKTVGRSFRCSEGHFVSFWRPSVEWLIGEYIELYIEEPLPNAPWASQSVSGVECDNEWVTE